MSDTEKDLQEEVEEEVVETKEGNYRNDNVK